MICSLFRILIDDGHIYTINGVIFLRVQVVTAFERIERRNGGLRLAYEA